MFKGYIIEEDAFEYDDSHYHSTGSPFLSEYRVFLSKEKADRRAQEVNMAFAANYLKDVWPWLPDAKLGERLDGYGDNGAEDFQRLLKILRPGLKLRSRASKKTVIEALDDFEGNGNLAAEDLKWIVDTFVAFRPAVVREVEIGQGDKATVVEQIEDVIRKRFPYNVKAIDVYTELKDGFTRVEADLIDGTEYFHKIEGKWRTQAAAEKALLASVKATIHQEKETSNG